MSATCSVRVIRRIPGIGAVPTSQLCGGTMKPGVAIPKAAVQVGDRTYADGAWSGHAPRVRVLKCELCGHSIRI